MTVLIKNSNAEWPYNLVSLGQSNFRLIVLIRLVLPHIHAQGCPVSIINNMITLNWEPLPDLMLIKVLKGKFELDSVMSWGAQDNVEKQNQLGTFLHLFLHPALKRIINRKHCLLLIASSLSTQDPKETFKRILS